MDFKSGKQGEEQKDEGSGTTAATPSHVPPSTVANSGTNVGLGGPRICLLSTSDAADQ